jgi:hypothetical protein
MTKYRDLTKLREKGILSQEELTLLEEISSMGAEYLKKRWDRSLPFEERKQAERDYDFNLRQILTENEHIINNLLHNQNLRNEFNPHVLFGNLYTGLDELVKAKNILDEGRSLYGSEQDIDFTESYGIINYKETGH